METISTLNTAVYKRLHWVAQFKIERDPTTRTWDFKKKIIKKNWIGVISYALVKPAYVGAPLPS